MNKCCCFFGSFAIRIFMGLHLSEGPCMNQPKRISPSAKYANQNLPIYVRIDVQITNNIFCEPHENSESKFCTAFAIFLESIEMDNVNFNGCQNPFLHFQFLEIEGDRKLFTGIRKFQSNVGYSLEK